MTIPVFDVIQGGLHSRIDEAEQTFVSAYVTDTRLMGVLALYAHWELDNGSDVHQFFYIDCEEAGLETCKVFRGEFSSEAALAEQALIGGLGAERLPLDENSFLWLMQHWKKFNEKHSLPLPAGTENYGFLFQKEAILSRGQQNALISSICGTLKNDYQVVNYFLMRCFGQDYEGAGYLTKSESESESPAPLQYDFPLDIYDSYRKATFCRNVIDTEKKYSDGSISYLCESLVEMNGNYETVISRVVVNDLKVIGFEHCSGFPLSSIEAALLLKKPEFVTVYEVLLDDEALEDNIGEFIVSMNTVMSSHESGRLFMAFKSTNDHVSERIFMLSNDVRGVYFLTDYGQLIVMAHTEDDIKRLEAKLASSPLSPYLIPTAKYEFLEPVLFEFIRSGYEDFDDFLD